MRMMKCYLANNRDGHFVTAEEVMSAPGRCGAAPPVAALWCYMPALPVTRRGLNMICRRWPGMC